MLLLIILLVGTVNSQCEYVDTAALAFDGDMKINPDGYEAYAYSTNRTNLIYTEFNGTGWEKTEIHDYPFLIHMSLNYVNGTPSIMVHHWSTIILWQRIGNTWSDTLLVDRDDLHSFAFTTMDNHLSFVYSTVSSLLIYGEYNGTDWNFQTINNELYAVSLVFQDNIVIWQTGSYNPTIYYASGGLWDTYTLTNYTNGYLQLLNVPGHDFPIIVMTEDTTGYAITTFRFNETNNWIEENITVNCLNIAPALAYINDTLPSIILLNNNTGTIDIYNHDIQWNFITTITPPASDLNYLYYEQNGDYMIISGYSYSTGLFICRLPISVVTANKLLSSSSSSLLTFF